MAIIAMVPGKMMGLFGLILTTIFNFAMRHVLAVKLPKIRKVERLGVINWLMSIMLV